MNLIFNLFLTLSATSWMVVVYLIKENFSILSIPVVLFDILLIFVPIVLALFSMLIMKALGTDSLHGCKELELADNQFLPVYLGYFFVSLSINDRKTFLFVFAIVYIFTLVSQTQYFNPTLLLLGYHYYNIVTEADTKVLVILRGKVIRNKNNLCLDNLKRINNTTFIK